MTIYGTDEQCRKYPGFYQKLPKEYENLLELKKHIPDCSKNKEYLDKNNHTKDISDKLDKKISLN